MLGDVPIFGCFSFSVDEKGRIFLPSMTNSVKGDQVVFCMSEAGADIIDAYPVSIFTDIVNKYDEILFSSTDPVLIERIRNERKRLCASAITQSKVDAQRRIFINPGVFALLGENTTRLYAQGEGNRIKLFGSKEGYENYTGHSYVKVV